MNSELYRLLVPGGILSPGELLDVIAFAREADLDGLHFGSRQDILVPGTARVRELAEAGAQAGRQLGRLADTSYSNVMCSYVASEIFPRTPWLTSATYLYILEQFATPPRLEVNITDPRQRLTPLFSGHLNFIASGEEDFWFVYVHLDAWDAPQLFPALVHSWDVGSFVEAAEGTSPPPADVDALVAGVNARADLNLRGVDRPLEVPFFPFPYYEGMNRVDASTYWLGLYWRNNWYDLDFLAAACELCLAHRVGKVCITPWKSLIISGIPDERRIDWERLLGRFGINARHSSLELNWHLPVGDGEALALKTYLVREFDKLDISTYGLTLGVTSAYSRPFTSVLIERTGEPEAVDGFAVRPTYNLLYARDFDPNTRSYLEYARRVDREELTVLIQELSRQYFEHLEDQGGGRLIGGTPARAPTEDTREVWVCGACGAAYEARFGDPAQDVPAGTPFAELPAGYRCWTCETPASGFARSVISAKSTRAKAAPGELTAGG